MTAAAVPRAHGLADLGFILSAVVQAVVRRATINRLLGDDRPRTLAVAAGLGAASSSCPTQPLPWRGRCFEKVVVAARAQTDRGLSVFLVALLLSP